MYEPTKLEELASQLDRKENDDVILKMREESFRIEKERQRRRDEWLKMVKSRIWG